MRDRRGSYGVRCVYFIKPVGGRGPIKIGVSQTPQTRLVTMNACSPVQLELITTIEGGETLERRFHAAFADQHIRNEWFSWSEELACVIALIKADLFDVECLPAPVSLIAKRVMPRAAIEAGRMVRILNGLAKKGVKIPEDVAAATSTYGLPPHVVAARRKTVADFVALHRGA